MENQSAQLDVQALLEQVAHQQQVIKELSQMRSAASPLIPVTPSVPHDLPVRPSFDWQPGAALAALMPTLDQPLFSSTLLDDECRVIVEHYPAIHTIKYAPPAAVPQAARVFRPG